MSDILNHPLPKWPNLMITGEPVSVEQAKEIIFKTDSFFSDVYIITSQNHKKIRNYYYEKCGMKKIMEDDSQKPSNLKDNLQKRFDLEDELQKELGFIFNDYIVSDYADSSYVGGPNGFCTPEGKIHFDRNIGKYPSVHEVYDDFSAIAKNFPFLAMRASLWYGEHCEWEEQDLSHVVSFSINNGKVIATDTCLLKPEEIRTTYDKSEIVLDWVHNIMEENTEGLPVEWYDEFALRTKAAFKRLGYL